MTTSSRCQIDQARGDLYAIANELEFLKAQIAQLPSAYASRLALIATSAVWALIGRRRDGAGAVKTPGSEHYQEIANPGLPLSVSPFGAKQHTADRQDHRNPKAN